MKSKPNTSQLIHQSKFSDIFKTSLELGRLDQNKSNFGDKLILVALCFTNLLFNICITIVIPFYPALAHEYAGIDYGVIGLVISGTPFGSILSGLIMPSKIPVYGRKYLVIKALTIQAIFVFIFGLLPFMTGYPPLFLVVSIISRTIQGFCRGTFGSLSFVYIPILWPNSIERKQGIMKSFIVLGIMAGPAIGAFLNAITGQAIIFTVISFIYLLMLLFFHFRIPPDPMLNLKPPKKRITFFRSFKSGQFIATFSLILTVVGCLTYTGPTFVNHMKSFELSTDQGAFLFSLPAIAYIFCLFLVPILAEKHSKGTLMLTGLLLTIFAGLLLAPIWTDNPSSDEQIILAQLVAGVGQAFCVIPSIPRLVEVMKPLYPVGAPVQNIAPGVFLIAISTGNFIAPNIGGSIYANFHGKTAKTPNLEKRAFQQSLLIQVVILSIILLLFCTFRNPSEMTDDISDNEEEEMQSELPLVNGQQRPSYIQSQRFSQRCSQYIPQQLLVVPSDGQNIRHSIRQSIRQSVRQSNRQSMFVQL